MKVTHGANRLVAAMAGASAEKVKRQSTQPRCEVMSAGTREAARGMELKKHCMHRLTHAVSK